MLLMHLSLLLASNSTALSLINPHQHTLNTTESEASTIIETAPDYMRTYPDSYQIDKRLKKLNYSQAEELGICLESLGPIDHKTPGLMITMIREHKKRAERCTGIYCYLKGFVPAADYSDLITSFEDFLERRMTSLRHTLPSTFSKMLRRFMNGYIKKKLVTRDSSVNGILRSCRMHNYDLDFVIGATNEYISWDQFYVLAAEYLGRKLSIISRLKKLLRRHMPKLKRLRKKHSSRSAANPKTR